MSDKPNRTETITSRERVYKTIRHEKADRMPIDLGVHFSTGISAFAYYNLRKYLGLDVDNIELIDIGQCLARVDDDIIERFHVDTILLNPRWIKPKKWNPRGDYVFDIPEGMNPVLQPNGAYKSHEAIMPAGGFFFDGWHGDVQPMSEDERLEAYAKRAEYIHKETDKFTMMMGFWSFFGDLDYACDMLTDPDKCKEGNQNHLNWQIEYFDKINRMFGKYIGAIEVNGDLGTQSGCMCTPDSYYDVCYPYLKKFCDHVHNTSDIKIFLHSCGAISDVLDHVADAGVDILNPVQISARGMDPVILKEKYGKKLCFWGGGCDTQNVLWSKTPAEVAAHVRENVHILGKDGGLVFNQVHNVMGNVPPENVIAMLNTAWETAWDF
ncbi:MAG: hypothetical protein FWD71_01615 [Oscillospiraceae bacterium]|nr:hypothetical protein [Oscillospiraceae bacterium]